MKDTIVALATPFGRSGIGVIRLSGKDSLSIVRKLVRNDNFDPVPRFATLAKIYDFESGEVLDETIVTYFKSQPRRPAYDTDEESELCQFILGEVKSKHEVRKRYNIEEAMISLRPLVTDSRDGSAAPGGFPPAPARR